MDHDIKLLNGHIDIKFASIKMGLEYYNSTLS